MKISVIIPTWNRKDNIVKTLWCVLRQDLDRSLYEVIVVDDNSTDGTYEALSSAVQDEGFNPNKINVKVVQCPKHERWNASIPRNFGFKQADPTSTLILFLDSDILLPPDRLRRARDIWGAHAVKNRVLIGPYHWLSETIDPTANKNWFAENIKNYVEDQRFRASFMQHEPYEVNHGIGYALACWGGLLMMSREMFIRSGGYDESVTSGMEDGEFGLTLWESGAVFSLDIGLLGWHNPHPIAQSRTSDISPMIKYIDDKHKVDLIKETGRIMRENGIDWEPPKEWTESFKNEA